MLSKPLSYWLTCLIVVVALPTIACFGYYAVDHLSESRAALAVPVMLAYPMSLIGLLALVRTWLNPVRTVRSVALAVACFLVPVAFVLAVRL